LPSIGKHLKNVFRQPSPVKVQNTQDTAILLFHRYVMQRNLKGFPLYWRATSGTQSPWFNFAFFVLGIQMLIMGSPNAGKRLRRVSSFDSSAGQRPALHKRHNKNHPLHDNPPSALVSESHEQKCRPRVKTRFAELPAEEGWVEPLIWRGLLTHSFTSLHCEKRAGGRFSKG
jgi:hypothetical protein